MNLTESLKLALRDCSIYREGEYIWKPKSMQKLAELGLAEKLASDAYRLTDAGKAEAARLIAARSLTTPL